MEFQIESQAGTIHVSGDMTVYGASEMKTALLAELTAGNNALDLSQVQEFDSAGLQLVLLLDRELRGQLKIEKCSPSVRATLELMNFKVVSEAA